MESLLDARAACAIGGGTDERAGEDLTGDHREIGATERGEEGHPVPVDPGSRGNVGGSESEAAPKTGKSVPGRGAWEVNWP
jgi:hypothetical protein